MSEMEAGRELDKQIIEKIFGVKKVFRPCDTKTANNDNYFGDVDDYYYIPSGKPPRTHMIDARPVPHFSTNIAAAWEVVEVFRQGWNGHCAAVIKLTVFDDIDPEDCHSVIYAPDIAEASAMAREMPLAICRAAIQAANQSGGKDE